MITVYIKHANYNTIAPFWQARYTSRMHNLKWLRAALIIAGVLSCVWIVYLYFGGNGTLTLTYQFNGTGQWISNFQPHGRALDLEQNQENGETYQRLVGEPTYFTVTLPSAYDSVEVALEYQNPNQTLIELGLKQTTNPDLFDYQMQPVENKLVDASEWDRVENDEYVLLQKEPIYSSVEEFLINPPLDKQVGTYLGVALPNFIDTSYTPNDELFSDVSVTLRGRHEFYAYAAAGEEMQFSVSLDTIDYIAGSDTATVSLWQGNSVLGESSVNNHGTAQLEVSAPMTGVYKLVVAASDDFLITHLHSTQERLVVGSAMHLAGSEEYQASEVPINTEPTLVNSNASWVTFIAKHSYGVGSYTMYNGDFAVNKVDAPSTWVNPIANAHFNFVAPQNDLYLQSDSYFALPGAIEFDPWFGFRTISRYSNGEHLDYVLSKHYTQPERLRGWTSSQVTFDLSTVTQDQPNTLQFMLSAPGVETTPEGLKVRRITINAKQHALTLSYLWEKLFGAN